MYLADNYADCSDHVRYHLNLKMDMEGSTRSRYALQDAAHHDPDYPPLFEFPDLSNSKLVNLLFPASPDLLHEPGFATAIKSQFNTPPQLCLDPTGHANRARAVHHNATAITYPSHPRMATAHAFAHGCTDGELTQKPLAETTAAM